MADHVARLTRDLLREANARSLQALCAQRDAEERAVLGLSPHQDVYWMPILRVTRHWEAA